MNGKVFLLLIIVLFAITITSGVVFVKSVSESCKVIDSVGLKGVVEELWEGKDD